MRDVKPASELRDRVPCPLQGTPRHPAAPCPSFYPNYGASAGPGLLGGDDEIVRIWPYIPRPMDAIDDQVSWEAIRIVDASAFYCITFHYTVLSR